MRIKEVLKERNLSYQCLADAMGVSLQFVKQTLNAPSVTTSTLEKISSALDVPMWQLFASPDDVLGDGALTALVHHRGKFYEASTISELEQIVQEIKGEE